MKKALFLTLVPVLLLAGCNKPTRTEIQANDFKVEATSRNQSVAASVEAKDYPFTKYSMVGSENNKEINAEYTYKGGSANWYNEWDYENKSEELIPHRVIDYEMYDASFYYESVKNYISVSSNEFKFYKDGNNLIVEAKYTSASSDRIEHTVKFNKIGYIISLVEKVGDVENYHNLTFTYSK